MEAARDAIAEAAAFAPDDAAIAAAHAHISFETWQTSAPLFERAQGLDPGRLELTRAWAAALNAEGDGESAQSLLERALASHPAWIDGHKLLIALRTTAGEKAGFDRSLRDACHRRPADRSLRLAWFHALATSRDWRGAREVIGDAIADLGPHRGFDVARAFLASESDEASADPDLFDHLATVRDPGLDLCRVRHALRIGRPERARDLALSHLALPSARTFWPYLSLAWRQLGDRRADWLDGEAGFVRAVDLQLGDAGLAKIDATLRRLLTLQAPFSEQSVRGGVQTDRHLFFNPDPVIQHLRARVNLAVGDYIAGLPPAIDDHPLLGPPRETPRYEGSWAVLLRGQGFHSAHTHKMGWISSALHISLPPTEIRGPPPAGCLTFGAPPPELGLNLTAVQSIEPRPGWLILFPSTTWHATQPIRDGERLSIAFDVQIPSAAS